MQGFINVYKPTGVTSAYVVGKLKKHLNVSKIGHMGTLDPLACGILPIAVGKATRMFDYFLEKNKQYVAIFTFGYETDTLDSDGMMQEKTEVIPTQSEIEEALCKLTGTISQIPPNYSAKKVNGRKAYELARSGCDFELKPKQVTINKFQLIEKVSNTDYKFLIDCSSGTYIRSLGRDLGYLTNSLATMVFLERTKSGFFELNNSVKLDDILASDKDTCDVISIDKVFGYYKKISVDNSDFKMLKNGMTIKTNSSEQFLFVEHEGVLLGLASVLGGKLKIQTYLLEE